MKSLPLILIFTVLSATAIYAQEPADTSRDNRQKEVEILNDEDSTVIHVGEIKVVMREDESGKLSVKIKGKAGEHEILTDKDNIRINEHGNIEIEEECGDKTIVAEIRKEDELPILKTRSMLLDIGISGYLNEVGSPNPPTSMPELKLNYGKSINVQLHLFRSRLSLIRHHLNMFYGLSLDFNNYRFADDYTLTPDVAYVTPVATEDPARKSKLSNTYLKLPVMLNFESNPHELKRSFHFSAGAYGSVLLTAHTKVKTETLKKIKVRDDFNLSQLAYGLTGQIGYGWFNIYANYALNTMFNKGEGPSVNPFSIGISLIGF